MPKASQYKDYTAFYVPIVPKKPRRENRPFTPSDNTIGKKKQTNPLIRQIDGYSFYALVTGEPSALSQLFEILPMAIMQSKYAKQYQFSNKEILKNFFNAAFGD